MQVIMYSLLARQGSTFKFGAWKGEFRDWTTVSIIRQVCHKLGEYLEQGFTDSTYYFPKTLTPKGTL